MIREAITLEQLCAMDPADAAAFYVARRAEGLTQSEQLIFAEWLKVDAAHAHELERAERAWDIFEAAEGDEILGAMRAHALRSPRRSRMSRQRWSAVAAMIVAVLGVSLLLRPWTNFSNRSQGPTQPPLIATSVQYASARGEIRNVTLPDGSVMTLDADSAALGNFNPGLRSVKLTRGRAYFAVFPDRAKPFSVFAADQRVTVVGTHFDVDLAAGALTVTLLQGRVTIGPLSTAAQPVTLAPGQQFIERNGKASVRTIGSAAEDAVRWRSGLIVFDDQTLGQAAAVMNRYSADQIVMRDPNVSSLRVSGQFRATGGARFAESIAEMHHLRTVRSGNQIELVRSD